LTLRINKKWNVKEAPDSQVVQRLAEELQASPLFVELCMQRGLHTKEEIEHFLHPDETWFHDPFLMHDMQKACERLMQAIEAGEQITVYGDYDADGVTSTSIMLETIEMLGGVANFFIPNRFKEGYGPNKDAFERLIEEGTQLILTVDNGVAGNEAIAYAMEQGVDVIVTDHHELPDELPNAFAMVHPKHPEGEYPFKELAGAGVALKLATALLGELPVEFLDLATIGTVADLVSLTDENRAIVTFGLKILKETQRFGLLALLKECEVKSNEVDETTIGFKIGPRLNAIGRLGDASPAVELLTTFDDEKALNLAQTIHQQNEERKALVSQIVEEARELIKEQDPSHSIYVLAKEGWHEGVLGIVASRIINETGNPTIVLNINSETNEAKGSGRSIEAFNLYEECNEVRELFTHFGGHHMAAGMTLPVDHIDELKKHLNRKASIIQETTEFTDELTLDLSCELNEISVEALTEIDQLRPFGTDNPSPAFHLPNVQALDARRIGVDKNHLKMKVLQEQQELDVIAFQFGEFADALKGNPMLSLAGTLEINEWNGNRKPQLMLTDMKLDGPMVFDRRASQLSKELFSIEQAEYVFFHEKIFEKVNEHIPVSSSAHLIQDIEEAKFFKSNRAIVFVDCPYSIELVKETFHGNGNQPIYCSFYSKGESYLKGLPSRDEFSKLYKFLAQHKNIHLQEKGKQLAKHLKLDVDQLKFMIRVFLEAGFVKIDSGLLLLADQPEKRELTETSTYKKRKGLIQAEEVLVYSSFKELTNTLRDWAKAH
jgi:single-stranded-DNA-specific exonuclease